MALEPETCTRFHSGKIGEKGRSVRRGVMSECSGEWVPLDESDQKTSGGQDQGTANMEPSDGNQGKVNRGDLESAYGIQGSYDGMISQVSSDGRRGSSSVRGTTSQDSSCWSNEPAQGTQESFVGGSQEAILWSQHSTDLSTEIARKTQESPHLSLHQIIETFGQNYPDEFESTLDCISVAVTCAFNKPGTLLAVGCNDGRIAIWDLLTRDLAKIISAHVHPVSSLSWSRTGFKLLSSSTDNSVCVWNVLAGECEQRYKFPYPVLKVQYHPRNDKMFLVCPMRHQAVIVNLEGNHQMVPLDEESDLNIVASFDRRGAYIYTGNAKGKVLVLSCHDLQVKASFKVVQGTTSATAVKSIEFSRRGEHFLINTADRVIRVYDANVVLNCGKDSNPEPIQKLQDSVNRTMWKKCCFSGDGEYICAGSAHQHALYVWEKSIGNLVKILQGTKGELLLDVVWHPVRPMIASVSSGVVSLWARNQVENWSAFAPNFKELDDNVEHEERESEFDLSDEDKVVEALADMKVEDEDEIVDVTTIIDPVAAFCSSDEEDTKDARGVLLYLPIPPEIEDPEEGWGSSQGTEGGREEPPSGSGSGKRAGEQKENTQPRKKTKTYDMQLDNPPVDETHPLLSTRPKDKRQSGSKKARDGYGRSSRKKVRESKGDGKKIKEKGKYGAK